MVCYAALEIGQAYALIRQPQPALLATLRRKRVDGNPQLFCDVEWPVRLAVAGELLFCFGVPM